MSLPKEPRQLMINLMYLVLTALLALNVSNEVINAFNIVDKSILKSNSNIETKNMATIVNFDDALKDPKLTSEKKEKINAARGKAEEARNLTKGIIDKLQAYRQAIVDRAGGLNPETGKIKKEEDLEAATGYMIEDKNGSRMLADMQAYKKDLADIINTLQSDLKLSHDGDDFAKNLPLNFDVEASEDNPGKDWSYGNFHMVPAVAATTIVDKYINDVKNSETAVLDELWAAAMGEKKQKKLVFTDYGLLVSAENSYLLPGQKFSATAMLGAYNKKDAGKLRISANGSGLAIKDGIATFTTTANALGEHSINFTAQYFDDNLDKWISVPVQKISYYVGAPQASVSLDKMNVFYMGVDNPITISASGIPSDKLQVIAGPNLTINRVNGETGKYVVRTDKVGKSSITLKGTLSDGTTKTWTTEYRLKMIPDPYPLVANKKGGGPVPVNLMKAQAAIFAKLDNFDFDAKFDVVSFELFLIPKRGEARPPIAVNGFYLNDNRANAQVRDLINSLGVGDRLFFENIKAKGPDGLVRPIGSLSFTFPN